MRFVANPELTKELRANPEFIATVTALVEGGKSYAESIAPRDTGAYGSSFSVSLYQTDLVTAVRLVSSDPAATILEWGARGGSNPAFHVLGRALEWIANQGGG